MKETTVLTQVIQVALEKRPAIMLEALAPTAAVIVFALTDLLFVQRNMCIAVRIPINTHNAMSKTKAHRGVLLIKKENELLGVKKIGG